MVSGKVLPPRIDLLNEDLLRSHLHAVFLSQVGLRGLDSSLLDLVDGQDMPLKETVRTQLAVEPELRAKICHTFRAIVEDFEKRLGTQADTWYSDDWIEHSLDNIAKRLDRALDRWRKLYRQAMNTLQRASQELGENRFSSNSKEYKRARRNQEQATRQLTLLKNEKRRGGEFSEFYPYRYLASEGFLPGYNFTRLPLRTFIPVGNAGEYISRARFIALREFGPGSIIYYNGQKYEVEQLMVQDAENQLKKAKISLNAGYFMQDAETQLSLCPFTDVDLSDNNEVEYLNDLLEMSETSTRVRERISCEEEERVRRGFQIDTYFSVPAGDMRRVRKAILKSDADEFLCLRFIPAAQLIQINQKLRNAEKQGFTIGMTSGFYKTGDQTDRPDDAEKLRDVKLFTTDTADALYIEPIKALGLTRAGVITLQYALKRAIENIFLIESSELGVVTMGRSSHPNIFLYEATEGSLGILSQFVDKKDVFPRVINEALRLLRFDDEDYEDPASYDDLLSYYNQRDHADIDRFLIRDALEKLKHCQPERLTGIYESYEAHYKTMCAQLDPNSSTEQKFLDYLYGNDLRLPDSAQKTVDGIYVRPDFFYEPDVWVFCDGTPHDRPEVKNEDKEKRDAIVNRGDQVIVYYYQDNLDELTQKRKDIFSKAR